MPDLYAPSAQQHAALTEEAYARALAYHKSLVQKRTDEPLVGQTVVVEAREQAVAPAVPLQWWHKVWLMQHFR